MAFMCRAGCSGEWGVPPIHSILVPSWSIFGRLYNLSQVHSIAAAQALMMYLSLIVI